MKTSTVGCSARAAAVVGLCVMMVAARSGRSARAISIAVVPLSRMAVPGDELPVPAQPCHQQVPALGS